MKIGYPCINESMNCTPNSTFRLSNYSESNLIKKVENNLKCLKEILRYNVLNNLLFFRISSDLVPFASHPVCKFNWEHHFRKDFQEIGEYIKKNKLRISMHPDQFVLINSPNPELVQKSVEELKYHCELLDLMGLDNTAKVQIHVGGVYGDKPSAIQRFIDNYKQLPVSVKNRLVIENDDHLFCLQDCLQISQQVGVPILFDSFHHHCLNNHEPMLTALKSAAQTWKKKDGIMMTDYSSQQPHAKKGKHTTHIDIEHFRAYINSAKGLNFDIMLEIKDKEKSALLALMIISADDI